MDTYPYYELAALIRKPKKDNPLPRPVREADPRIYESIKTFEDAFQIAKGHFKINKLPDFSSILSEEMANRMSALLKLEIVTWAINNDNLNEVPEWIPNYQNKNQEKWFAVYRVMFGKFEPVCNQKVFIQPTEGGGAKLVFKDKGRVFHSDKYFRQLYKDLYFIESDNYPVG